jgi:hypothetical protein
MAVGTEQVVVTDLAVDYTALDSDALSGSHTLTHVGVYTHSAAAGRALHRHFLRLADGAIVEVPLDPLSNSHVRTSRSVRSFAMSRGCVWHKRTPL